MHMATALAILVLSELCLAIRVPTIWDGDSAVHNEPQSQQTQETSENIQTPQQKVIPAEYFVYTAQKPQFAVDVAQFHGVHSPLEHYKAHPIRPYTGKDKPKLGSHRILDENRDIFKPFQEFSKNAPLRNPTAPASVEYEIFHPYKAEEPALQQIYKDPVLTKIRDDIRDSQYRLQHYENEAGKPNIAVNEYQESPEETDRKKVNHKNVAAAYEVHRPQRRPVYYRYPQKQNYRNQVLNQKFKHPWNQNYAKIRPVNYRPLKNHLQKLRQHHAVKYDDEHNEYPQLPAPQLYSEPVEDGYDIYESGKQKYIKLRNNVDDSINKVVQENRPTIYQKLELQNNEHKTQTETNDNDEDEEFVPVKNYAQVRKTETTKHLPREAAFQDAESFDEIRNAPRLREAVKSTKAQTVYTEEGYEDAAYDHAGEQKHASENEGHAGYLKEKEISGGKYKIPSLVASYEDGKGSNYRDQTIHGKQWKISDKEKEEDANSEDYSEDESEQSVEADIYQDISGERNKREYKSEDSAEVKQDDYKANNQHELNKRNANFKIPAINLNTTLLSEEEIIKISKLKVEPKKTNIKSKYPYYFKNLKYVHKDSPLRYAENLKLIPKKSSGGTEFYDSRSQFECPEVDDKVEAIPEKLKKNGHPDNDEHDDVENAHNKGQADFDHIKEQPRLKGLGDKIDCFKTKYFGENPLDSPFFKEDIIKSPEPVTAPNLAIYTLKPNELVTEESKQINVFNSSENYTNTGIYLLLDHLRNGQKELQESLLKRNNELRSSLLPQNFTIIGSTTLPQQTNIYSDVLNNIKNVIQNPVLHDSITQSSKLLNFNINDTTPSNTTYNFFLNKEDITKLPPSIRNKRSSPFVYEPYKIIRDAQVQDSKKTTTTSNISPLIKQLQSSRVADRVTKENHEKEQPVKRNIEIRPYKNIGRKDREKSNETQSDSPYASFVDVSIDKRRGEPRYELRPANHKSHYTPVENKKAMSMEDYHGRTNNTEKKPIIDTEMRKSQSKISSRQRLRNPTVKSYYDVSQFLPKTDELQKSAASNTVNKIIKVTTQIPERETKRQLVNQRIQDPKIIVDYEEYDDDIQMRTTTKSSILKPAFRIRRTTTTTTVKPQSKSEDIEAEVPKLRLITRFRNGLSDNNTEHIDNNSNKPSTENNYEDSEVVAPKYREKKKKTTKSTLITDTKTYGDGEDDLRKEEVDALIGVQQDMDEYTPLYEKEAKSKQSFTEPIRSSEEDDDFGEYDEDEDYDDNEDNYDDDEEEDDNDNEEDVEPIVTTSEPGQRTLVRTTEAPVATTEARSAKLELKPVIMKKQIEIHKETPVNKSSPHITQFKQDIKEVEIIKEIPTRSSQKKTQKNLEALELYKDEKLPKEINKLGDVEVFRQNLDLKKGPRHGGNYRSAKLIELQEDTSSTLHPLHGGNLKIAKDAEASQSENTKLVELGDAIPARRKHGGNLKYISDVQRSRNNGRNAKFELDTINTTPKRRMHGGNLRSIQDKERRHGNRNNAKLIEFDDEHDDDDDSTSRMHGGNFKSYGSSRDDDRSLHGGNYRSAKLVQTDDSDPKKLENESNKGSDANARSTAAGLLNSFVQAIPILTTTPAYILDPSKRKYYYVDA